MAWVVTLPLLALCRWETSATCGDIPCLSKRRCRAEMPLLLCLLWWLQRIGQDMDLLRFSCYTCSPLGISESAFLRSCHWNHHLSWITCRRQGQNIGEFPTIPVTVRLQKGKRVSNLWGPSSKPPLCQMDFLYVRLGVEIEFVESTVWIYEVLWSALSSAIINANIAT